MPATHPKICCGGIHEVQSEIVVRRVIEAPRGLVFSAWTDPDALSRWWGPKGFSNPVCEVDARPGGGIRIEMCGPDGTLYPMAGLFRDVVPPEKLVFTSAALNDDGHPLFEVEHTVTFAERWGTTRVEARARVVWSWPGAPPDLEGMEDGWQQSLERLAGELAGVPRRSTVTS